MRAAGVVALTVAQAALADAPIILLYSERPPFMHKQPDGSVAGTTATPVIRAFTKAAIPFELREASPARRLLDVKENKRRVCSLGFYKTTERESYARYSKPVSQDSKMIGLVNAKSPTANGISVDALLQREDVSVLIKESIVYGPYLESQFSTMKARRVTTAAEFAQLFEMIKRERAQLLFMPEEEAHFYLNQAGYSAADFKLIQFAGMPPGEQRYIMCSMQVDEATVDRLNKAIDSAKPQ
jgi:uncharacterized protein (TIGR02285 family)